MKTILVDFESISPTDLEGIVLRAFPQAECRWRQFDQDSYEMSVYWVRDLAMLEDVLAEWV